MADNAICPSTLATSWSQPRFAQIADPTVPEVKEMAHRLVAARVIVDNDRGGVVAEPALDFDRGDARVECQSHIVGPEGRRKDDPVHASRQEPFDALALALGVAMGVRQEDVKALFGRRLFGPHCDLGIERV